MTRFLSALACACALLVWNAAAFADTVTLKTGRKLEGIVLQETPNAVSLKLEYGTITVPRAQVASVLRASVAAPAGQARRVRVPAWGEIVTTLSAKPWASGLRQIPATVVDKGVLRHVPYQSFYCGDGYELNIYGDPDDPACFEIGKQKGAPADAAKRECLGFVAALLGDPRDAAILKAMDLNKEIVARNGLTMEVTPPDGEDAYGGWWVSVYDEAKLDRARAPEKELAEITVARASPTLVPAPAPAPAASKAADTVPTYEAWSDDDYRYTRSRATVRAVSPSAYAGARVYVRGYYRKNGTYVRPYSRRR